MENKKEEIIKEFRENHKGEEVMEVEEAGAEIEIAIEKALLLQRQEIAERVKGMKRDVLSQYAYQGPPSKSEVARELLKSEGFNESKKDVLKIIEEEI